METRIMFLIFLLLIMWLLFTPKGKAIIARFVQFVINPELAEIPEHTTPTPQEKKLSDQHTWG